MIAAQSIGEPGTQLTMRTFHIGGAASRAAAVELGRDQEQGHAALAQPEDRAPREGSLGRGVALRRTRRHRRLRPRARALQDAVRRGHHRQATARPSSRARSSRPGIRTPTRWSPKWRASIRFQDFIDGITVQSQVDEVTGLSSTVVLNPKQRGAGGKDLRPVIKLLNAKGKEVCFANTDIPAVYALPAGRAREPGRRRQGVGRRRHRAHPAGILEDPRHHRRSAARGGPVRGPQAEGLGDPRRVLGHGQLRQGNQGQAPPDHHRRAGREARGADPEVAPPQRVRRRARRARRSRSRTASRTRTTSCACRASSRWPTTWCAKSRTSTACRA